MSEDHFEQHVVKPAREAIERGEKPDPSDISHKAVLMRILLAQQEEDEQPADD